jgi:hypothetical protein
MFLEIFNDIVNFGVILWAMRDPLGEPRKIQRWGSKMSYYEAWVF